MKRLKVLSTTMLLATTMWAQNPVICDRYTPDPAPYVHGDTLYLFVDHDEDVTQNGYFTMKDWLLYSTVDMVNWTYRGTPLTSATFSAWAKQDNDCWASQCIERNGKWYWYVTATIKGEAENSFTIHGGSVEYKGHHYMFYHNGKLPDGGGYKRATCIEEFTRNDDGTLPFINFTTQGVAQLQSVNPYERQEAETINQCKGVKCEGDYNGCYVTDIGSGDYIKVRGVDFGDDGTTRFTARVRAEKACGINIRIGSSSGKVMGKLSVDPTDGQWQEFSCELSSPIKGLRDLYFTYSGKNGANLEFDSWQFTPTSADIHSPQVTGNRSAVTGIYDLNGRRTNGTTPSKTIKIVNGKKVM